MTCRVKCRVVLVCWTFLFALVLPALAAAQDQPPKANVVFALSTTARGGTTLTSASGDAALKVGETGTKYLYTSADGTMRGFSSGQPPEARFAGGVRGGTGAVGASGVTGGVSGVTGGVVGGIVSSPENRPPSAPANVPPLQYDYLWQVDVKPVSIAIDVVTFEMDWKRTDVKDGARQVAAGDHRTITLRQGEKHLLDFIVCPEDSRYANVFLELQASPVEDPSVEDATFGYDLWLVHQTADGAKVTRHAVVTGRQGEKVNFTFASVPLSLDAAAPDADSPYRLRVSGTIAGRVKPDGTIEIALRPTRREQFATGGGGIGGGTKTFVAKPEETISIALPAGNGYAGWRAKAGFKVTSPRPGVSVTADQIRVDLKPFFEGTNTSILVTVRREK